MRPAPMPRESIRSSHAAPQPHSPPLDDRSEIRRRAGRICSACSWRLPTWFRLTRGPGCSTATWVTTSPPACSPGTGSPPGPHRWQRPGLAGRCPANPVGVTTDTAPHRRADSRSAAGSGRTTAPVVPFDGALRGYTAYAGPTEPVVPRKGFADAFDPLLRMRSQRRAHLPAGGQAVGRHPRPAPAPGASDRGDRDPPTAAAGQPSPATARRLLNPDRPDRVARLAGGPCQTRPFEASGGDYTASRVINHGTKPGLLLVKAVAVPVWPRCGSASPRPPRAPRR